MQAQPRLRGQGSCLQRNKSQWRPWQAVTQPELYDMSPQGPVPQAQGISGEQRVLHDGVAGSWNVSLRGWGRLPSPTAPDLSLASGQMSTEKAQGRQLCSRRAGSFQKPLEDQATGASHLPQPRIQRDWKQEESRRGAAICKLPHPAPGGQSSPQGQPRTGWEQAVRRSADQSSRPETIVGLG